MITTINQTLADIQEVIDKFYKSNINEGRTIKDKLDERDVEILVDAIEFIYDEIINYLETLSSIIDNEFDTFESKSYSDQTIKKLKQNYIYIETQIEVVDEIFFSSELVNAFTITDKLAKQLTWVDRYTKQISFIKEI